MAKLTKTQRRELDRVLGAARQAHRYIHDDRTVICHTDTMATTTLHRPPSNPDLDDRILYPVEKFGSKLVYLDNAIADLTAFLERNQ